MEILRVRLGWSDIELPALDPGHESIERARRRTAQHLTVNRK